MSVVSVVCCQVEVSATGRGVPPSVIRYSINPPYSKRVGRTERKKEISEFSGQQVFLG